MRLQEVEYREYGGRAEEWGVSGLKLGAINLIVGENATGKTRTLNTIRALARMLLRKKDFNEAHWKTRFEDAQAEYKYELQISEGIVRQEELFIGKDRKLRRGKDGTGIILAVEVGQQMSFKVLNSEPAVLAKRDLTQHPFLEPLHEWAASVLHYPFSTPMGKDHLTVFVEDGGKKVDPSNFEAVVALFRDGAKQFQEKFEREIMTDMIRIGYDLEEVGVDEVPDIPPDLPFPGPLIGLYVQEQDMGSKTWQTKMSQGMFRALSLIIQTVYGELTSSSSCVIIDDIGEGLDHERSTKLIGVLIDRAKKSDVQLIMATNDRFVMNAVPLEAWSCLRRTSGGCEVLNYENSKALFDEFALTGLNNFDFLATKFLSTENQDDE